MVGFYADGTYSLTKKDFLLAGCFSGCVSRALVQPLDVLKIRFQLQVEPITQGSSVSKYHGFVQAVRCITKEEGFLAFWKGHVPAQLQAVTFSAAQFITFEVIAAWIARFDGLSHDKSKPTLNSFFCGCLAGAVAASITQPLDVLRTRFIAQGEPKVYQNLLHAGLHIAVREGAPGYFRGLLPSLLLIAPQTGLQFAIYQTFVRLVRRLDKKMNTYRGKEETTDPPASVGAVQSLIGGGLAGIGAKCAVYPLDMAKKRMQVRGFEEARSGFGRVSKFNNLRGCLANIYQEEGALALFKGLRPTLLKSCISISCRFTVYDQVCYLVHRSRKSGGSRWVFD